MVQGGLEMAIKVTMQWEDEQSGHGNSKKKTEDWAEEDQSKDTLNSKFQKKLSDSDSEESIVAL